MCVHTYLITCMCTKLYIWNTYKIWKALHNSRKLPKPAFASLLIIVQWFSEVSDASQTDILLMCLVDRGCPPGKSPARCHRDQAGGRFPGKLSNWQTNLEAEAGGFSSSLLRGGCATAARWRQVVRTAARSLSRAPRLFPAVHPSALLH